MPVPQGWRVSAIKRRYAVVLGKMLASSPEGSTWRALPYVRAANVQDGWVDVADLKEMWFSPSEVHDLRLREGDLLVCEGGDVGRCAIWDAPLQDVCFQNSVNRVRSRGADSTRFLAYALHSLKALGAIDALCNRATIAHFTAEKLGACAIALPPPDEQHAIADFLDRETARIDALVAKQGEFLARLDEHRRALVTEVVTRGLRRNVPTKSPAHEWLSSIPAHWEERALGSFATKITNGYVGPTRDILVGDGVTYLQSLHIKHNRITFDGKYFVSAPWSAAHAKSILKAGDVLIVQTGDIGQVAVVPPEFEGANCHALIIIRTREDVMQGEYLAWLLNSEFGVQSLRSIQTGALHPHLNCGNVKFLRLPVPPLEEQAAIIDCLNDRVARLDILRARGTEMIERLREHRAALITAAVTGGLRVAERVAAEAA